MLKNNLKLNISKNFLFCLCVICLMFSSASLMFDDVYAADLNNDTAEMELISDISDNTVNSHENELLGVNNQEPEILGVERNVKGNTFEDIQDVIDAAKDGDTIKLSGTYVADGANNHITIKKRLNIIGSGTTILDGQSKSIMFNLREESAGTTIKNIKFINGYGTTGSAVKIAAKNVLVEKCTFENNHCYTGGAVYTAYDLDISQHCIIRNCTFTKNNGFRPDFESYSCAAAVGLYGRDSEIIDCVFDSNWVKGKDATWGGAIQVGLDLPGSNGKVTNCIFRNNEAISIDYSSHGGAGCIRDGTSYTNCIFINNKADEGGALTFHASGSIVNCTFIDNKAGNFGGALSTGFLYDYMELNIINCNFDGNFAPEGGAIQAKGLNVNIRDSIFKENNVTTYGGAVKIEAEDVTITNSIFNSNEANVNGGALYIEGKNTVIKDSSFISNNAIPDINKYDDGLGGAIYVDSSQARISNNYFMYNTARNGSAIYYGLSGEKLTLMNNTLYQNQAWAYQLPIYSKDIYYGDDEEVKIVFYGGNNIADYDNLAVSNAIYNSVNNTKLVMDGEFPVNGATNTGELYQDGREYNINVLLTIQHEDGTLIYNELCPTNYLGEITVDLKNLKPGKYYVSAKHYEDTYYTGIMNTTTFVVNPKVDNKVTKTVSNTNPNYQDIVIWTLNITNQGPNNSTRVIITDILPEGLIWLSDDCNGKYDPKSGILNIDVLNVKETLTYNIITLINKTGVIVNKINITSNEFDTNLTNNYDEKTININPAADLSVIKHVSNNSPNYLDKINWTIEVTNNGPDIAHDVIVEDIISNSLIYIDSDGNYDNNTGIWTIGMLEKGQTVKLNIQCIVKSTGLIQNKVNVTGREFDYDLTNNDDFEIIYVNPASDLAIEKTVNSSKVNYLEIVKWTLTITNNGPDAATNVKIEDMLPEGFIYINSTLTKGKYNDDVFEIESIDVGEKIIIEIITQAVETGEFINIAIVSADENDYNLTNNMDNESITVNPASDLMVTKTSSESNPKYHDIIEWTITIINNGPDTAHNVTVKDLLPESLIWIEDDSSGQYSPINGILLIDELEMDETFVLTIQCLVNATGLTQNNVSVNGSEFDYNLTNNNANDTIDVEKSADVSIVKLVNQSRPNYNDLIKWILIISNKGPDKATNIYVEDILPDGLILINYNATKGFYDNNVWAMCCLNNGDVETLEIVTRVNKTGELTNIAKITADEYDYNLTNNEDNESINTPLAVDVEVIIEVNNTDPLYGEIINWMITVKNNGPDNATEVILHDILPQNLIFIDYNSSKGDYFNNQWDIGSLNVNEIQYLNITTIPMALGEIINNVDVESEEYDWNKSNNNDSELINVKPVSDLSIIKSVNNLAPKYGKTIIWTLIASNNGPNVATDVMVYESLPEGLSLIKSNGNYDGKIWNIGSLNPGESRKLEIICKVDATGKFVNNVTISGNEFDSDLTNNHDEKSINVDPASDLSVTKIASKYNYKTGEVIEYIIEVVNNGPDTAKNIRVNEILDKLLKLKSFKVTKGKFNKFTLTWSIKSLGYGESAILYIKAIAIGAGIVKNKVSVSSDTFDYDLSNNHDFAVVNVSEKVNHNSSISSKNSQLNDHSLSILEKHATGNPFWMIILSLVFSLIFVNGNIFQRK